MKFNKVKYFFGGRTLLDCIGFIILTIVFFMNAIFVQQGTIKIINSILISLANSFFFINIIDKIILLRKEILLYRIAQAEYQRYLNWKQNHPDVSDEYYFKNIVFKGEFFKDEN